MLDTNETIVALATARQGAARGVIRISGPAALDVASRLSAAPFALQGRSPQTIDVELELLDQSTATQRRLPAALLIWPGEQSYTCQPTVEIHTIGSVPLLEMIVRQASRSPCRLAAPGEFTMRALLAGRIDLTQAEAVLGVIDAGDAAQLEVALAQLAGGMSRPLAELREELLMVVAELEAGLDFAEEDIEFISPEVASQRVGAVATRLEELCDQLHSRVHVGELPRVVLVGPPNAGKSSLFNALVDRYGADRGGLQVAAIVSPTPGATRDYLAARLAVGGVEFALIDTAGETEVSDTRSLARAAQEVTRLERGQGAIILSCSRTPRDVDLPLAEGLTTETLRIVTRCDESGIRSASEGAIATSAVTGQGLGELARAIATRLERQAVSGSMVPATASRCDSSLRSALAGVRQAHELIVEGHSHELVVHQLRIALDELGQVAGTVATDDILDRVFRQFCIGK